MPLLRKRSVQNRSNLLRTRQIPVDETRLQMPRRRHLVLRRRLDGLDAQGAQRLEKVVLLGQVQGGPLEKIDGVDVLDDGAVFEIFLDGRHGGVLGRRVIELALCAYFEDLNVDG